jgi:hypothetical protein
MTGTAEGIVNGSRQSVPLTLVPLRTPGVYAVRRQWPEGRWVLSLTGTCPGRNAEAGAVVPLDGTNRFEKSKVQFFEPRTMPAAIDAALQASARGASR